MPRLSTQSPKYRKHKASGQAVVTLNGRDFYLGPYGSPESKAEYDRLVGEWQLNNRVHPAAVSAGALTVDELILAYREHIQQYYRKDGRPTTSQHYILGALKPVHVRYGQTLVDEFGPLALKNVRTVMIEQKGWARPTVNKAVGLIKQMFKWAVANEMAAPQTYQALQAVAGLRRGRSQAREPEPVEPAPEEQIHAALERVSSPVAAMVHVQWLTGMRPDEVVSMRSGDIDRSSPVWVYTPGSHKTEHVGKQRRIFLGPRVQQVLVPYLKPRPSAFLFSPQDAEEERRTKQHAKRHTPLSCGNKPGTNRKSDPKRRPREAYSVSSYRRAIQRACDGAYPPPERLARQEVPGKKGMRQETDAEWCKRLGSERWEELKAWRKQHLWHPNQLRHNAATYLRKQYGIEAARVVLGHSSAAVTEVYAELDFAKAAEIMGKVG